jgi:hypothetical protein
MSAGSYIACYLTDESNQLLLDYCKENNIKNNVGLGHITIFSSDKINVRDKYTPNGIKYVVKPCYFEILKSKSLNLYYLILVIDCPEIIKRNAEFDTTPGYFRPHITLSYNYIGKDLPPEFKHQLYFENDVIEDFIDPTTYVSEHI